MQHCTDQADDFIQLTNLMLPNNNDELNENEHGRNNLDDYQYNDEEYVSQSFELDEGNLEDKEANIEDKLF
jgi:hypothetical protein